MRLSVTLAIAALAVACAGEDRSTSGWQRIEETGLDAWQRAQLDAATTARDAMKDELLRELTDELASGTAASAIAVCRDRAPEIARAIGERQGVTLGRTSWKLRNPENGGPDWTESLLADRPEEPRFAAHPDGRLGATFPIRVADGCLGCHGPEEALDGEVRLALAELYPDDRATGFESGDLRGWFWIEVPR